MTGEPDEVKLLIEQAWRDALAQANERADQFEAALAYACLHIAMAGKENDNALRAGRTDSTTHKEILIELFTAAYIPCEAVGLTDARASLQPLLASLPAEHRANVDKYVRLSFTLFKQEYFTKKRRAAAAKDERRK